MQSISIIALVGLLATGNLEVPVEQVEEIDRKELHCLAKAVYHESRGEPRKGQIAVAHVVLNRVASNRYPDTACEVVHQPHQFTDIQKVKLPRAGSDSWNDVLEVATFAVLGVVEDPTAGATMYHNPKTAPKPRWDFGKLALVGDINQHRFYKEKR